MEPSTGQLRSFSLKGKLADINSLLLVPFAFVLPMWIAPTNIIAILIAILWLLRGQFRSDFEKIRGNRLVWALIAYFFLHVAGLLWTSHLEEGPDKVARAALFLFVPVFMMVLKREHARMAVWAFIASMMLSCAISFLIYFQVDPSRFRLNGHGDPIPFMSHIHYSVYLAIAITLLWYFMLFDSSAGRVSRVFAALGSLPLLFDLLICNGRAGQMIFFLMLPVLVSQYFGRRWPYALSVIAVLVPLLSGLAYMTVQPFRIRVEQAFADVTQYRENKSTSLGERSVYAQNALELFIEHPLFGVGTGDFESELEKIHRRNTPGSRFDVDPHNMFLLEMGQFGILGLISIASIFYAQFSIALHSRIRMQKYLGITLAIMFCLVSFSDIYLQLHFTAMLFILLSSVVYTDYGDF